MYKDDMICDGIENCIQYIDNFNPEKSRNPFAYFTQIVYYAFSETNSKEKRQMDIKDKIIEKSGYDEVCMLTGIHIPIIIISSLEFNSMTQK